MNFNEFGQFEMTNTQTENAVGGTRNRVIEYLTAAPAIHQSSERVTTFQIPVLFEAQEIGEIQHFTFNTLTNQENTIKGVTVN